MARRTLEMLNKAGPAEAPTRTVTLADALKLYEDDYMGRNRRSSYARTILVVREFAEFVGLSKSVRKVQVRRRRVSPQPQLAERSCFPGRGGRGCA